MAHILQLPVPSHCTIANEASWVEDVDKGRSLQIADDVVGILDVDCRRHWHQPGKQCNKRMSMRARRSPQGEGGARRVPMETLACLSRCKVDLGFRGNG